MIQIPRSSQVPIIEPMYTNGVMNPAWVRFFEKLAALMNTGELASMVELIQLSNQLPVQAITGQMAIDMQAQVFDMLPLYQPSLDIMPLVSVTLQQSEVMPLNTIPSSEIITP